VVAVDREGVAAVVEAAMAVMSINDFVVV